jgi:hypothetical protein
VERCTGLWNLSTLSLIMRKAPVGPLNGEVSVHTSRNRRTSNSPIAVSRSPAARFSARAAATVRSTTGSRVRTTAAEPPTSHDTLN